MGGGVFYMANALVLAFWCSGGGDTFKRVSFYHYFPRKLRMHRFRGKAVLQTDAISDFRFRFPAVVPNSRFVTRLNEVIFAKINLRRANVSYSGLKGGGLMRMRLADYVFFFVFVY